MKFSETYLLRRMTTQTTWSQANHTVTHQEAGLYFSQLLCSICGVRMTNPISDGQQLHTTPIGGLCLELHTQHTHTTHTHTEHTTHTHTHTHHTHTHTHTQHPHTHAHNTHIHTHRKISLESEICDFLWIFFNFFQKNQLSATYLEKF